MEEAQAHAVRLTPADLGDHGEGGIVGVGELAVFERRQRRMEAIG